MTVGRVTQSMIANRSYISMQLGAARLANIDGAPDPQHVAAVKLSAPNPVNREALGERLRRAVGFRAARGGTRPGNHRMLAEQDRGVLHEHRVRMLFEFRQTQHVQPCLRDRLFIGAVLLGRTLRGDRLAAEVGQFAIRDARAQRPGEGNGQVRLL